MTDGDSRLCKLSLHLIFVTLSWSTHAYVFHPCDVASPAQLHLKQDGLYAGQAGSLDDFFVRHMVLPFDAKDGAQAALMKPLMEPNLLPIENPGLCIVQEGRNDDGPVHLDLFGEAERVTLPCSL